MIILDLSQGSADWLRWRHAGLGASDAPLLMNGKHFERTLKDLWEEKVSFVIEGKQPPTRVFKNAGSMARGQRLEPEARGMYERLVGCQAPPVCCYHADHPWLKASLDGWIPEKRLVLEIKAPNKVDHQLALDGRVPPKYEPQLVHQLLVTGGKLAHYASYNPYFEGVRKLAVVGFPRKEDVIQNYFTRACQFWQSVLDKVLPSGCS